MTLFLKETSQKNFLGDFVPDLHETLKSAAAAGTRAPRGSPADGEGRASKRKRSELNGREAEKPGKLAQDRQVAARGAEKTGTAGIDGRGSGSSSTGSRADQVQYKDLTKYKQERVSKLLVTPADNCNTLRIPFGTVVCLPATKPF